MVSNNGNGYGGGSDESAAQIKAALRFAICNFRARTTQDLEKLLALIKDRGVQPADDRRALFVHRMREAYITPELSRKSRRLVAEILAAVGEPLDDSELIE